ncbi:MAG: hypothetical protein AB8I08_02365 [Sandaracinaceae bacterium]
MSEDPADFEKAILSSDKRFEIYVPQPAARLNMGVGASKAQPEGPYGHSGVTLSAADNVFVESGADMVIQSGKAANLLASKDMGVYVGASMTMTASEDLKISAGQRVLVISGSHNDPSTRANSGELRLQAYNNLAQHYRIDSLDVGLFEFFHGRRQRPKKSKPSRLELLAGKAKKDKLNPGKFVRKNGKAYKGKRKRFSHSDKDVAKEIAEDKDLQGGWAGLMHKTLYDLYPAEIDGLGAKNALFYPPSLAKTPNTRKKAEKGVKIPARKGLFPKPPRVIPPIEKIKDSSDPRYLVEAIFASDAMAAGQGGSGLAITAFGGPNIEDMEFGFSRYFHRFDPYKRYKKDAFSGFASRGIITLKNGLVKMRRMLDCLLHAAGLPGALAGLLQEGLAAVPVLGPVIGALSVSLEAYGAVAEQVDSHSQSANDPNAENNPFAEPIGEFGKPFEPGSAEPRKASVKSEEGPWDLITDVTKPWEMKVENEDGEVVEITLDPGPVPPRPATLTFAIAALQDLEDEDGDVIGSETVELVIEVDGRSSTLNFDSSTAGDADAILAAFVARVGAVATVTMAGDEDKTLTITTQSTGAGSRILVTRYEDDASDEDPSHFALVTGWLETGHGEVPPVADMTAVTASEIGARLVPHLGTIISEVEGCLRISSEKVGDGSKVVVSGNLANTLWGAEAKSDHVQAKMMPDWDDIDSAGSVIEPIKHWVDYAMSLPDKAQGMLEPITDACQALLDVADALEKVAEAALAIAALGGGPELPDPPEAVGIFGTEGITLGTHDRIVGQGGHGILFVVDGASGEANKGRQQGKLEYAARFAGGFVPPAREKQKKSLGFRVMSDSVVDMTGNDAVQLVAMGRGKSKEDRVYGSKIGGIGVARVLSSWVTEVAAHDKVIIAARSKGDSSSTDGTTGGRVEVAGQTIAIGGIRNEDKDADGNELGPWDFEVRDGVEAHSKSFGIAPIEMEEVSLSNHLIYAARKKDKLTGKKKPPPHLKANTKYAWPEKLRKEHPVTERVHVHSSKEAVIVVGPYMVHVSKDAGVVVGRRKANKDPSVNELDDVLGNFTLDDRGIGLTMPNKDKSDHTALTLFEGQTVLRGTDGSGDPGIFSATEGSVTVSAGSADSVEISKSDGMKVTASKIDLSGSGAVKIKGGQIQIG